MIKLITLKPMPDMLIVLNSLLKHFLSLASLKMTQICLGSLLIIVSYYMKSLNIIIMPNILLLLSIKT